MELRNYLRILRRRALVILLTVLAGMAAAWFTTDRSVNYTAETSIYIGASRFSFDSNAANLSADRSLGLDRIMATYTQMIPSEPVSEVALEITGIRRSAVAVAHQTTATIKPSTNLLLVRYTDSDPVVAQQLSIGMAEAFLRKLNELEPGQTVGEAQLPSIPASIFQRPLLPTVPTKASLTHNLIVGGLFGGVLACAVILLIEYLDVTVKSAEDAERRLELPVLGVIVLQRQGMPVPVHQRAGRAARTERAERADPVVLGTETGA